MSGRLIVHQDGRPVGADRAAQVPGCLMVCDCIRYALRLCTYDVACNLPLDGQHSNPMDEPQDIRT